MKDIILTLLIASFMTFSVNTGKADDQMPNISSRNVESIEWQKIKLQEVIRKRYEAVISKVIVTSKYIVNAKIEINSLDKSKPDKAKDLFKDVKQVKFNNNPSATSKGDSIIFAKLGLEAPLITDEDNYKRESIKKTISDINTAFDIFSFLKSVTVEVLLNEKLEIKTRKVVEDLILGTQVLNNPKIKPRVSIKYISMEENFVPEKKIEPTQLEKLIKLAPKYANAMGLIISVLIFGIVASFIFKKYSELQEKKMELEKSRIQKLDSKNDNKGDEKNKKDGGKGLGDLITDEESIKAFERFRNFLKGSPVEAQLLIKKWISAEDELSRLALNSLVKQLTNEELKSVFEILTLEERKNWKAKLKLDMNENDIKIGNDYISGQIVDDIIAPPMVKDPELLKIISQLTPAQGAEVAKYNVESGIILMNIMPPKFLAEMLEHMSEDMVESIIQQSAHCSEEEISLKLETFKEQLPATQAILNKSPFLENIMAHIAFATPSTERYLFKLLASAEPMELVVQSVISNLPIEIIKQVHDKIVKAALQNFPQAMRVQYFYSQSEDNRKKLLDLFAPEGSKVRELVMFEFEKIESEPGMADDIEKEKSNLEKFYNQTVRKVVRNSPEYSKEIRPMTLAWIEQLVNPVTASEVESLEVLETNSENIIKIVDDVTPEVAEATEVSDKPDVPEEPGDGSGSSEAA